MKKYLIEYDSIEYDSIFFRKGYFKWYSLLSLKLFLTNNFIYQTQNFSNFANN